MLNPEPPLSLMRISLEPSREVGELELEMERISDWSDIRNPNEKNRIGSDVGFLIISIFRIGSDFGFLKLAKKSDRIGYRISFLKKISDRIGFRIYIFLQISDQIGFQIGIFSKMFG